ncbi:MAG: transcriptional regulator GcvA [Alphaproteobacteria bacterium]|nr:transcriptional regulator GcvA [Alphaproteobacteria bacterium]
MATKSELRRLPPLNGLRCFEAAARHVSFARAAQELHVTPSAVSHQIRALEDILGVALFRRERGALVLTDAGAACLPGVRDGFARLLDAVQQIDRRRRDTLKVSVAPSFAAKWLLPRLERFLAGNAAVDVRVEASMVLVDFTRDETDLAIRYGGGRYPGLVVERLMGETVFPVCSPDLLRGDRALREPADIRFHTLLHDDSPDEDETCPTWPMWLAAAGVTGVDAERGLRFNQSSLVIEAAVLGRGLALAKATLVEADLANGRLVRPFELSFPLSFAYHLVCPEAKLGQAKVRAFRDWVRAEAAAPLEDAEAA